MDSSADLEEEAWEEEQDFVKGIDEKVKELAAEGQEGNQNGFYEEFYFDSEDESKEEVKNGKRKFKSNDELMYDDNEDEMNENWINEHLMLKDPKSKKKTQESDAVLSCPGCFSPLCYDCQQHDYYPNQFRAMFVLNCKVIKEEILTFFPNQEHKGKSKNGKRKRQENPAAEEEKEVYHPVKCASCGTEVAVMDKDEVYHFFHVIAGE